MATAVLLAAVAVGTLLGTGTQAHAASAYRYWAYYLGAGSSWQYSQRGPATDYPTDGEVQGWRFAVQSDGSGTLAPRTPPDFGRLCASTAPSAGRMRIGIVLDFGVAPDAPAGEHPPAAPVDGCVSVPDGASGIAVLDAAVGNAGVRIGTGSDAGLVCGIAGYPKTECAVAVAVAAGTPRPAVTVTPSAKVPPSPTVRPSPHPSPRPSAPPTSSAAFTPPAPTLSTPAAASTAPPVEASSPVTSGAPVRQSSAPALALTSLRSTPNKNRLPISALVGGLVIVALAVATAFRLRRGRRSAP